jgi:hypothetical protein
MSGEHARNEACSNKVSRKPLMRRETRSLRPPIFLEHFLSGTDNRRVRLFKAYSGHGSIGNYPRLQRGISHVLGTLVQILNQGWKWVFYGWSLAVLNKALPVFPGGSSQSRDWNGEHFRDA